MTSRAPKPLGPAPTVRHFQGTGTRPPSAQCSGIPSRRRRLSHPSPLLLRLIIHSHPLHRLQRSDTERCHRRRLRERVMVRGNHPRGLNLRKYLVGVRGSGGRGAEEGKGREESGRSSALYPRAHLPPAGSVVLSGLAADQRWPREGGMFGRRWSTRHGVK